MSASCFVCGSALSAGRFCPACGSEQPDPTTVPIEVDPFIGRTISDRYEVTELINIGGMGRVYKAQHSALGRTVAIKFIHPHLLTAEEIVTRFMVEAQTASRLNHPNVVSIFDFGRTPASEGGHLFLVMEYLAGPDLSTVLHSGGPPMKLQRIADVLCQTLAALGEAHHLGITHRDVKPENIILEPKRSGGDQIKVIDFGIAKLGGARRLTAAGQIVGTPYYMAPEQASGAKEIGPGVDLYAVGVILFELLTGQLPFDGATPDAVMIQQLSAPRPDPRDVAPDRKIPAALAAVVRRAIDIDPAKRFTSAEDLAKAIVEGISEVPWSSRHASLFPPSAPPSQPAAPRSVPSSGLRSTRALAATTPAHAAIPEPAAVDATARALSDSPPAVSEVVPLVEPITTAPDSVRPRPGDERPLVGRDGELAWARAALADRGVVALAMWGRTGTGKSRLLREIARLAEAGGARVLDVAASPHPRGEVTCSGLRAIIRRLVGVSDPMTAVRGAAHLELDGLRAICRGELPARGMAAASIRRSMSAALAWAVRQASEAGGGKRVVLAIDDADQLDGISRASLADLVVHDGLPELVIVTTTSSAPDGWFSERVRVRPIEGLSEADAERMLAGMKGIERLGRPEGDIEPLYVEQLMRWHAEEPLHQAAPPRLVDLVEWRMRNVPAAQRRTLQVLALVGGGTFEALAGLLPRREDLAESIEPLSKAGFITKRAGGGAVIAHRIFGQIALAIAPRGALADLHARVADALAGARNKIERRAYHAIRGRPDFEAFLLLEECARRRTAHGDDEGAIAALQDGLAAARAGMMRGDVEATSGCLVFGHKLGEALLQAGRLDEAMGVLSEILDLAGPNDLERALTLEQLALVAERRDRSAEAEARRREALVIADKLGNRELAERLRKPPARTGTGPRQYEVGRSDINALGSGPPSRRSAKE